jgi:hypothetical protein
MALWKDVYLTNDGIRPFIRKRFLIKGYEDIPLFAEKMLKKGIFVR